MVELNHEKACQFVPRNGLHCTMHWLALDYIGLHWLALHWLSQKSLWRPVVEPMQIKLTFISTYLHLDFYLSTDKYKRHSRAISQYANQANVHLSSIPQELQCNHTLTLTLTSSHLDPPIFLILEVIISQLWVWQQYQTTLFVMDPAFRIWT